MAQYGHNQKMSKASTLLTYFLILQQNLSKRLHSFKCTAILDIHI